MKRWLISALMVLGLIAQCAPSSTGQAAPAHSATPDTAIPGRPAGPYGPETGPIGTQPGNSMVPMPGDPRSHQVGAGPYASRLQPDLEGPGVPGRPTASASALTPTPTPPVLPKYVAPQATGATADSSQAAPSDTPTPAHQLVVVARRVGTQIVYSSQMVDSSGQGAVSAAAVQGVRVHGPGANPAAARALLNQASAVALPKTRPFGASIVQIPGNRISPATDSSVFGNVTDQAGAGLSGVTISAVETNGGSTVLSTISDVDGNYGLSLSAGTYNLTAQPPAGSGFGTATDDGQVVSGNTIVGFAFVPATPVTLSGRVLDARGNGVSGLQLYLQAAGASVAPSATTDAGGSYSFTAAPGQYDLFTQQGSCPNKSAGSAVAQCYSFQTNTFPLTATTSVDLSLPFKQVAVHVQDSHGSPVPNASVDSTSSWCSDSMGVSFGTLSGTVAEGTSDGAVTDGSGNATLWLFPTNPSDQCNQYWILANPPSGGSLASAASQAMTLSAGTSVTLTLQPATPVSLTGHLLDALGSPIASQWVYVCPQAMGYCSQSLTGSTGSYTSTVTTPGLYYLSTSQWSSAATQAAASDYYVNTGTFPLTQTTSLDVRLPFKHITVHVADGGGAPVADAAVTLGDWDTNGNLTIGAIDGGYGYSYYESAVPTDAAGNATFWLFPTDAGCASDWCRYAFSAAPPSGSALAVTPLSNVVVSADASFTITMGPATLSGTVYDEQGHALSDQWIGVFPWAGGNSFGTTTNSAGTYGFDLSPSQYFLYVNGSDGATGAAAENYYVYTSEITLTQSLSLDLYLPFQPVTVHVEDATGAPVSGVTLTTSSPTDCYLPIGDQFGCGGSSYDDAATDSSGNAAMWLFPTDPAEAGDSYAVAGQLGSTGAILFSLGNMAVPYGMTEIVALSGGTTSSGTINVPGNYSTIAAALAHASFGMTVKVAPGTYLEPNLLVPPDVSLVGADPASTTIDGDGASGPVVRLESGASLQGFTVQDSGTGYWDAGVWLDGPATVTNNRLLHNSMSIVRYCWTTPCSDTSTISGNLVAHNTTAGILVNGAGATLQHNTIVDSAQAVTYVSNGAVGSVSRTIIYSTTPGISAPNSVSLDHNLIWQAASPYGNNTTPGGDDIQADPLFVAPQSDNYSLHAGSPARDPEGDLGAYPFAAHGTAPSNLTAQLSPNGGHASLSWQGTGASGYYVYYHRADSASVSSVDAGASTAITVSLSLSTGRYDFAVSAYDAQGRESDVATASAADPGLVLSTDQAAIGQMETFSGYGYRAGEAVSVTLSGSNCAAAVALASVQASSVGDVAGSFSVPNSGCTVVQRPDKSTNAGAGVTVAATGQGSGSVYRAALRIPGASAGVSQWGTQLQLQAQGFAAGEQVSFALVPVTAGQAQIAAGTFTADSSGAAYATIPVPPSLANAHFIVTAQGGTSGFTATMPGVAPGWYWQNPTPTGGNLQSVSCLSADHCVAVGQAGAVLIGSISGAGNWALASASTADDLSSVSCLPGTSTCYAVGWSSEVYVTTDGGATWVQHFNNSAQSLMSISCPDQTICYAVGDSGTIYAISDGGATWTLQTSNTTANLRDITCPSVTTCIAVGDSGTIVALAGGAWAAVSAGTTGTLSRITCQGSGLCYVSGYVLDPSSDTGTIDQLLALTYADGQWTMTSSYSPSGLLWLLGCSSASCYAASYDDSTGYNLWSVNYAAGNWSIIIVAGAPGLDYIALACVGAGACVGVGLAGALVTTSNGWLTWAPRTTDVTGSYAWLNSVHCASAGVCFATQGWAGDTILATTDGGATWIQESTGLTGWPNLTGIDCPSASLCFAVGSGGAIARWTPASGWAAQSAATSSNLAGISCPDASTCYAVGSSGTVLKWSGSAGWSVVTTSARYSFGSISCPGHATCYAASFDATAQSGAPGAVVGTTDGGQTWSPKANLAGNMFPSISCGSTSSCVWVSMDSNDSDQYIGETSDGFATSWTQMTGFENMAAVKCISALVCIGAGSGIRVTTDGGISWQYQNSGMEQWLYGIDCLDSATCFAVGTLGGILASRAPTPPQARGVTVTDLGASKFAVTFTTSVPGAASLIYGTSADALTSVAYDDRDGTGPAGTSSTVHRFTLSKLTAGTTYYFEPVVNSVAQPGPGGAAYSQAVPQLSGPPSFDIQVIGSALLQDGTWPLSGTVLLTGYWTNHSGVQSAPLSVLSSSEVTSGAYNYLFTRAPLTQDGSAYFTLDTKSVFHVSGAGDQSGQLGTGGPVSATVATSGATTLPSFRLSLAVSVTYTVQRGWNLLALPLAPTTPLSASTLLAGLLAQTGGSYAEIDGFTNGQWSPSYFQEVRPTPLTGGSDYTLALGQGYALYSDQSGTITLSGLPAAAQSVSLARGWNLVGFPDAYGSANPATASSILSGLLGQTHGNYAELDGFTGGAWAPSYFEEVSPSVTSPSDYSVAAGQGYALYTDVAGTLAGTS